MLSPRDTLTRERKCLNGLWSFRLDPDGTGRDAGWWRGPLAEAREMPVPASYNDVVPDLAVRHHVGDAWYQTTVRVPRGWAGEQIVLRFDSATHRAVVWVDDVQVAEHEGGYTPFEADVTEHVRPGDTVRITVVVNNELSWASIPPGHVSDGPAGRTQNYFHDFFNYAGLHRSVWLYSTPNTHVIGLSVDTGLDGSAGSVRYTIEQQGEAAIRAVLRDADGVEVAAAERASAVLTTEDVHPWAPGDGHLYELEAQLLDTDGALVDSYPLPVGVRTVEVRGTEFLINGVPFHFRGFGKHEDAIVRGKGHDDVLMAHDFELMAWIGANSFRTAHYPYAEEVLDYADRHGIVVIDETAAVGMNLKVLVNYGVTGLPTTYSEHSVSQATQQTHLDTPWSEEYQSDMLEAFHRVFDRIDAVVGEHVWNFADFATRPTVNRVDGNKKGVFTRDRRPKTAAFTLRRRWKDAR